LPRSLSRLSTAVFVAGIVLAGARAACAFEITQSIPNSDVTACLDVKGAATASGTAVETYPCNGGFNEQWAFTGGGLLQVYNTSGSAARCLSFANSFPTMTSTSGVVITDCNPSSPPAGWVVEYTSIESPYNITIFGTPCLDSQGNYGSGAQAVVGFCSGAASQIWELKNIVIAQPIPGTSNSACVNVRNRSIANGTPVDAYPCTLGVNTRFTYANSQLQGIVTNNVSICLGETSSGAVEMQTCNGTIEAQTWILTIMPVNGGTQAGIVILNNFSGNCLDSQGNYGSTAQLVDTPSCNTLSPAASTLWKLH
jgi:hypothetical protein